MQDQPGQKHSRPWRGAGADGSIASGAATATAQLVGRERELARLQEALARAEAGAGELIWLLGPGGIGKSRLTEAAMASARELGMASLAAAAREFDRHRPFAVLLDCLGVEHYERSRRAQPRSPLAGAARARPGQDDADAPGQERRAQVRRLLAAYPEAAAQELPRVGELELGVGEALAALLEDQCERRPTLVALDDLQWADDASMLFIARLLGHLSELPLVLLCAARPLPRRQQLDRLLALSAERGATRIELLPLAPLDAEALAAADLGAEPGDNLRALIASCGGNPLFVSLLIETLKAEGMLAPGAEDRIEAASEALPASLDATVLARLSSLGPQTLDVLRLASLLGGAFSVSDLAELSSQAAASLWPALRDALRAGALAEDGEELRFAHDVVREALYRDMPASLRAAMHLEHGRALAARGGDPSLVAEHLLRGARRGDRDAVSWLERAAREVAPRGPASAAELLEAAVELCDPDDPARGRLMTALGLNLVASGRREEGEAICRRALQDGSYPPGEGRLRLTLARSLTERGQLAAGLQEAARAARSSTVDLQDRARALCWAVTGPLLAHDLDAATAAAARALEAGEQAKAPDVVALALVRLGHIAGFRGEFAEQLRHSARALAVAEREDSHEVHQASHAHLNHAFSLADCDRPAEGVETIASGRRAYQRLGMEEALRNSHHYAGYPLLLAGRWDEALAEAQTALALSREFNLGWTPDVLALQALILVRRDELEQARALVGEAQAAVAAGAPEFRMRWVAWAQALLEEADGAREQAVERLWSAFCEVGAAGVLGEQRALGGDLARLLADERPPREEQLARRRLRELASAMARLAQRNPGLCTLDALALRCRGLAEQDPDVLAQACERHDPAARPYELALCHEDAAVLIAQRGERERAGTHAEAALELFTRLGAGRDRARLSGRLRAVGVRLGARGPRRRELSGWESLTPSERRVAEMAAAGLSNPQIAERLVVSRHTVATHISHILAKLELRSRFELAGARDRAGAAAG